MNARAEAVLARTGLLNTLALPLSAQEQKQAAAKAHAAVPHLHLPRPTPRGGTSSPSGLVPAWALQPAHSARRGSKGRAAGGPPPGAGLPVPHGGQAHQHRRGDVLPGVRVRFTLGLRVNAQGELCVKPTGFTASAGPLHTRTESVPPWVAPLTHGVHGAFTWVTRACGAFATSVGRTLLGALQEALSDAAVADGTAAKRVDGAGAASGAKGGGSGQSGAVQRSAAPERQRSAPAEPLDQEMTSAPPHGRPRPPLAPTNAVSVSDETSIMNEDLLPPRPLLPQPAPRVSLTGAATDDESAAAAAHALVASLLAGTSDDLATLEFSAANRRASRSHLGSGVSMGMAATPSTGMSYGGGGGGGLQTPGDTPMGPGMAALVSAVGGGYGATSDDALREAARIELGRMRQGAGDDLERRQAAEEAWAHEEMVPTPEGTPAPPYGGHLTVDQQREVWSHNREVAAHAAARRYSAGGDASDGGAHSPSYGRTSVLHIR